MDCNFEKINKVISSLSDSRILLVVPPFSLVDLPCIGLDILQTIANSSGIKTSVLYANMLFAECIGIEKYKTISSVLMSMHTMLGERVFAKSANHSLPTLGKNFLERVDDNFNDKFLDLFSVDEIYSLSDLAMQWTEILAAEIAKRNYEIVGVTTGHQQTNAAVSLINRIKELNSSVICIIGGSACDGEMAEGILTLSSNIDYVFSGESEISWRTFLQNYQNETLPKERIIRDTFLSNLDELDVNQNTYQDYFDQLAILEISGEVSLLYESSRGCWWGERNKCTFCGLNGWSKHYRYKSETKVLTDLETILKNHPEVKHIQMVDTLMPRHYFNKLIPSLKMQFPQTAFFYEQRADLSLSQILSLKLSGVNYTQVGIEALSTDLLRLLNKGIKAEQNLQFLRYSRSVGLLIGWNLLTEIPNDKKEYWIPVLDFVPMIYHLNPPMLIRPVEIARFSPYYEHPDIYGIHNITPNKVYREIFSETANLERVAWLFDADFTSDSKDDSALNTQIKNVFSAWINRWKNGYDSIPSLKVIKTNMAFFLEDSRYEHLDREQISIAQAKIALFGVDEETEPENIAWGVEKKVLYFLEGKYVPLATAHPRIFKELSNE